MQIGTLNLKVAIYKSEHRKLAKALKVAMDSLRLISLRPRSGINGRTARITVLFLETQLKPVKNK